jgi:hypothetical protein
MGEVMPVVVAGFVILVIMVMMMAKVQFNKKVVHKPLEQEDMVERVKIHLTGFMAKSLAAKLVAANAEACASKGMVSVEIYEQVTNGRLIRFEVKDGEKSAEPRSAVGSDFVDA